MKMRDEIMNQEQIDQLVESLRKEYGNEYERYITKKKARARNRAHMRKLVLAN